MLRVTDLLDIARLGDTVAELAARRQVRAPWDDPRAPVVVWSICRQCNMSCAHCPAAATTRRSAHDLTQQEVVRILGELASAGVRKVIWSGGEPLLRDDLPELVAAARDRGIESHLWSNGTFLHVHARALADAGLAHADVTLDGPRERNDAARGVPGGFELAVGGLRAARAAGLPTGIRMMVARHNGKDLGPMLDVAAHLDVDRFTVSHLVCSAKVVRNASDDLSPAESRELLLGLFERIDRAARPLPAVLTDVCAGSSAGNRSELDRAAGGGFTPSEDATSCGGRSSRFRRGGAVAGARGAAPPALDNAALLVRFIAGRHGVSAADRVESALRRGRGTEDGEGTISIDHRGRVHPTGSARSVVLGDLRRCSFAALNAGGAAPRAPVSARPAWNGEAVLRSWTLAAAE